MRGEVYKIKVNTRDELLGGSFDAAATHIKKREDQLSRTTRNLCIGVAKCIVVSGGIFEHLLWTVTNLSCKRPVKIKLTVSNFSFFITIHSPFVVDSNNSISETIQNYTDVQMKFFFLTMTDTITFQYIDIFSELPCVDEEVGCRQGRGQTSSKEQQICWCAAVDTQGESWLVSGNEIKTHSNVGFRA